MRFVRGVAASLALLAGVAPAQDATPARDQAEERFAEMDGNGDGRVDKTEWDRAIAARLAARTSGTAAAADRTPPRADAPLPLPTARQVELMRSLFGRIDSDGDGGLTLDEVRGFGRALGAGSQG